MLGKQKMIDVEFQAEYGLVTHVLAIVYFVDWGRGVDERKLELLCFISSIQIPGLVATVFFSDFIHCVKTEESWPTNPFAAMTILTFDTFVHSWENYKPGPGLGFWYDVVDIQFIVCLNMCFGADFETLHSYFYIQFSTE